MTASILKYRRPIDVKYDDFIDLTDHCLILGDLIVQNLGDRRLKEGDCLPIHYILAFNHLKATDALVSTTKLVDAGLIGDGEVIVRKLLDIAINLKYLSLDVDKRQYQYWHFMTVSAKKTADQVEADPKYKEPLRKAMSEFAPEARKRYDECVDIFEKDSKGKPKLQTWSGLNTKEMADKGGLSEDYRICYKLFSASTHGSIGDFMHYFDPERKLFEPRFESDSALALLLEAVRCYLIITEIVIKGFSLDFMDSHKLIGNKLESFRGDSRLPIWPTA